MAVAMETSQCSIRVVPEKRTLRLLVPTGSRREYLTGSAGGPTGWFLGDGFCWFSASDLCAKLSGETVAPVWILRFHIQFMG